MRPSFTITVEFPASSKAMSLAKNISNTGDSSIDITIRAGSSILLSDLAKIKTCGYVDLKTSSAVMSAVLMESGSWTYFPF